MKNKPSYFKENKKSVDDELSRKLTEDGYVKIKAEKEISKTLKELRSFNSNIDWYNQSYIHLTAKEINKNLVLLTKYIKANQDRKTIGILKLLLNHYTRKVANNCSFSWTKQSPVRQNNLSNSLERSSGRISETPEITTARNKCLSK